MPVEKPLRLGRRIKMMIFYKILFNLFIILFLQRAEASFENLTFHKTIETLEKIKEIIVNKQKGAYLRFGDGDIVLANGGNDLLQTQNRQLQLEMREALALNGPTVLKTLPLYCKEFNGWESGMFPGNHETPFNWCVDILDKAKPFWNAEFTDVYSHVALHFSATQYEKECIDFLKFIKELNCVLLIGNKNIPVDIRETLFGKSCQFIPTPDHNSYNEINRIEKECLEKIPKDSSYKIIITSMGCSGRALQKRLWHKLPNVFLFDFGSLMDALCGWDTRAWITLSGFDAQRFLSLLSQATHSALRAPEHKVKIVCSAALLDNQFEVREKEYRRCFEILSSYGYTKPYIVEAIKKTGPTFLDSISPHVFYSQMNNAHLKNKGINEARTLLEGLTAFKFDSDQMILKLSGRYHLSSDFFLHFVENNTDADAIVKVDPSGQIYTFCFAMKYKYLLDFLQQLDYKDMEKNMVNLEQKLADYIKGITHKDKAKVLLVDTLHIDAHIFGTGSIMTIQV